MLQKLLLLSLAGAAGTLARYGLTGLMQRIAGPGFPWGTFAVNIIGSFIAGLLWAYMSARANIDPTLRIVVLVGFMGAFTTFSTLMLETGEMIRGTEWLRAIGTVALHNIVGFVCVMAGLWAGRIL